MDETELKIRVLGDPVLRKKAKRVLSVSERHRKILSQMARIMYESQGIGLAAPQVGVDESMIVIDIGTGLYKLINPRIVKKQGHQSLEEGCLSCPGVSIKVKRAKKVFVTAFDENEKKHSIEADNLLACVFQHEIDHLNGKLIVDYASLLKKLALGKKIRGLSDKEKNEAVHEPETKSAKL
jgi:peptide deformylase